jgi:hypothetical protein
MMLAVLGTVVNMKAILPMQLTGGIYDSGLGF